MQPSKIVKGIDIGSSKITTIVGQYLNSEDKLNIIAVSSTPAAGFRKGQIIDLEKASQTILQSVEAAERMAGFQINDAVVSLAAPHIESINSQGVVAISNPSGEIEEPDINRVIDASKAVSLPTGKEIIHVIPRIFTVDGQQGITDPVGMNGVRLEVESHIILASSPAIKNLKKCFQTIGLNITSLVFSGLSTATIALTDTEKELGVGLIDIGGNITTITIFFQNSPVFCSVIPVGGDNVTNDLAIGLRFSIQEADKIKTQLSRISQKQKFEDEIQLNQIGFPANDKRKISLQTANNGIVKPRLEEIFNLVYEQISKSGFKDSIPAGLVLTGGGSQTINAAKICSQTIPLPLRTATPPKVGGIVDNILTPSHTSSIGLLVYAQQHQPLPPKTQKDKISLTSITSKIKSLLEPLLP